MKKTYISPEVYFELLESDNDLLNISNPDKIDNTGGDVDIPGLEGDGTQEGEEEGVG